MPERHNVGTHCARRRSMGVAVVWMFINGRADVCGGHPGVINGAPTVADSLHVCADSRQGITVATFQRVSRRGATCDARCRNGTTSGRIVHAGGAWAWRQSDVHKRPGGCLRRSSGPHKWRTYGGGRLTRLHGQPSRSFRQPSRIFCQPSCQTQKGYEDRAKPSRTSQPALHGYKCFYQHKPTELRMF